MTPPAAEPSSPRQHLAAILAACPHIYTVDEYGGVGPGAESVEAYALPDGTADWLLAHGVRLAPPARYVLPDNHPAKEGFRAYEDGIADGLAPEDAARMGIGVALALTVAPPDQARREGPQQAWLIERDNSNTQREGVIEWWTGDCLTLWTSYSHLAIRFARKEDAERVIDGHGELRPAVATSHIWLNAVAAREG